MKIANVAHAGARSPTCAFSGVPRGWVLIGAALAAWLIFAALGLIMVRFFSMILALI